MNVPLVLESVDTPVVRLRAITDADLEDLRLWKNANRAAFFFKGELSREDQKRWFQGYSARPQDFMFMVEAEGGKAGCMGFRILESGAADCYNIIGVPAAQGRGIMSRAMAMMCGYIRDAHCRRVGCLVIKENPAVGWYTGRCAYRVAAEKSDHVVLELDETRFKPVAYRIRRGA
ncbi:MAG: GNAT family N-acetyltransferase [Elusimicrobiota bacterium]|jgi:RimJ/RimL family protein N-acetyltransferase